METPTQDQWELGARMLWSRVIGALFLAGFLSYGVGFWLVDSIVTEPDFVATVAEQKNLLVLGAVLMLLNTGVDIGKGVLFFPILEHHGKRTALVYLAALIAQVVLMDIGVLFLFAQPAIGTAFLEGMSGVRELNEDVYGPTLIATAGIGLLLFLVGAIVLGVAIARTDPALKWVGVGFAGSVVVFVLGFLMLDIAQPIGAALLALVGIVLALRLPEWTSRHSPARGGRASASHT